MVVFWEGQQCWTGKGNGLLLGCTLYYPVYRQEPPPPSASWHYSCIPPGIKLDQLEQRWKQNVVFSSFSSTWNLFSDAASYRMNKYTDIKIPRFLDGTKWNQKDTLYTFLYGFHLFHFGKTTLKIPCWSIGKVRKYFRRPTAVCITRHSWDSKT